MRYWVIGLYANTIKDTTSQNTDTVYLAMHNGGWVDYVGKIVTAVCHSKFNFINDMIPI